MQTTITAAPLPKGIGLELTIGETQVKLSTEEVDTLRSTLMAHRPALWPPLVRGDVPRGEGIPVEADWQWFVQMPPPPLKGAVLHVWHRGLGWLSFLLPPQESRNMAKLLSQWTKW